jgi:hypothetical protein
VASIRPSFMKRKQFEAPEPPLVQFVVLSMLLHVLVVLLVGTSERAGGGSGDGLSAVDAVLAPRVPDTGFRLRVAPPAEIGGSAPAVSRPSGRASQRARAPSRRNTGPAAKGPAAIAPHALDTPAAKEIPSGAESLPRLDLGAPEVADKVIEPRREEPLSREAPTETVPRVEFESPRDAEPAITRVPAPIEVPAPEPPAAEAAPSPASEREAAPVTAPEAPIVAPVQREPESPAKAEPDVKPAPPPLTKIEVLPKFEPEVKLPLQQLAPVEVRPVVAPPVDVPPVATPPVIPPPIIPPPPIAPLSPTVIAPPVVPPPVIAPPETTPPVPVPPVIAPPIVAPPVDLPPPRPVAPQAPSRAAPESLPQREPERPPVVAPPAATPPRVPRAEREPGRPVESPPTPALTLQPATPQIPVPEVAPSSDRVSPGSVDLPPPRPAVPSRDPASLESLPRLKFGAPEDPDDIFKARTSPPVGVVPPPGQAPRLNLDAAKRSGPEIGRSEGRKGIFNLNPPPPEAETKLGRAMQKAAQPDCRDAYAAFGLLAVPFLLKDTITDTGCRW